MADQKLILTPEQAEALLLDGEYVHSVVGGRGLILGADLSRDGAVKALHRAVQIEIGGPGCKAMGHPLVVWDTDTHHSFFQADMDKVAACEAAASPTTEVSERT